MVRISDARMSGTAYGTVVLHSCPESAAGGPLAFVKDGDEIELDVAGRKLNLHVSDQEMANRARGFKSITGGYTGYQKSLRRTMCCRRTRARILASWSAAAATPSHVKATEGAGLAALAQGSGTGKVPLTVQ